MIRDDCTTGGTIAAHWATMPKSSYNPGMAEAQWWQRAKIYELYVDAFAGTFNELAEHVPYFTKLGVNCLHILPHFPSPMVDDGYDIIDYRGIRPDLGTIDDFEQFVAEAHRHEIRVIIDFVLNHTSDQHPWFIEARCSGTFSAACSCSI